MNLEARRAIAEKYLEKVRWNASGEWAHCQCPGFLEHENPNKLTDAIVYLKGRTISLHCFHTSCAEVLKQINRAMRSEVASLPDEEGTEFSREEKSQWGQVMQLAQRTLARIDDIYRQHWRGPELLARALPLEESRKFFFAQFDPQSVLWIGNVRHSGTPNGMGHFRRVCDWQQTSADSLWSFTCTGEFKSPGTIYRGRDQVAQNRFHVLEFDHLDPDPSLNQLKNFALCDYLEETYGLCGRFAVDSGNKSAHHWVEADPEIFDDEFKAFLKALGADPAGWRPYQPVRFPGVVRAETQRPQNLIPL